MSAHDDFPRMSDEELENFIHDFPNHTYFRAASFEHQRRQSAKRDCESKQRHEQTQRLARWAIAFAAMSVVVGVVFGVTHSSRLEWQLLKPSDPLLLCHSMDEEQWLRAEIDLVAFAAVCGQLMS
jgi:hypothetical protein